jgi:hypothetical protein
VTSRQARHQRRLVSEGYCATSREHGPPRTGSRLCEECLAAQALMQSDARAARADAGQCRVNAAHGPPAEDRSACQACLDAQAAAARVWRKRRTQPTP